MNDELHNNEQDYNDFEARLYFAFDMLTAAYWSGQVVGGLWLVACISRCCAPCCCELPDVDCPCSPCKVFHAMDLCFFVGFFMALFPVNVWFQGQHLPIGFMKFFIEYEILMVDFLLVLGLIMLLTATILGCVSDSYTTTVAPPQVVGSSVMVQSNVVQGNEPV